MLFISLFRYLNKKLIMKTSIFGLYSLAFFIFTCMSCSTETNLFSVQQDIEFGQNLDNEIQNRTAEFTILNESLYSDAYIYLYAMRDEILIAPQLNYRDRYEWELRILQNDSLVNAFCNPGGYIYIYTGLLKYLSESDQLAGMLAQLIAHCDQRQITASLTALYGTETLMQVANQTASSATMNDVLSNMQQVYFTKEQVAVANQLSVDFMRICKYACNAAALYLGALNPQNPTWGVQGPLQTSIAEINQRATDYACSTDTWHSTGDNGDYAAMLSTLP